MLPLLCVLPLFQGCAWGAADEGDAAVEVGAARLSDSLLNRPELQRVVDLQVARDGAGLVEQLADGNPLIRARALYALASVQDSAAVPAILPLLDDAEWTVRRDAAFALGQSGLPTSAPALLAALEREEEPEVRRRLIEAVGKIGDRAALQRLNASAMQPGEASDRMLSFARFGIRGVHHPDVVRALVDALGHDDPLVREHAAYYFGRVTNAEAWRSATGTLRGVLDELDRADPAAMHLLTALGRLADPEDRARFTLWAEEGADERIRTNAVRALGSQPAGARTRDALVAALGDRSTHVGVTAATALAGRELPSGELERVRRWIEAHPLEWRVAAPLLPPLVRGGHTAFVIEWMERWSDGDGPPRAQGLAALAVAPGEEALRVILTAASSPNRKVRIAAVGALATRWNSDRRSQVGHERYYGAFTEALASRDGMLASVAAPALASQGFRPFGSAEFLEASWQEMEAPRDADAMFALLDALADVGEEGGIEIIRRAVDHAHPPVARRAARALERATGEPVEVARVEATQPVIDWEALRQLGRHPRLVLETEKGRVVIVLAPEQAPLTVQAVTAFSRAGRYDGTPFHRVVPNFVVQGGDFRRGGAPPTVEAPAAIRSEFNGIAFGRGVIGMASSGKDTETSQFYITHSMQPHLDGGYTAFGWVVEGMDVVDSLFEDDRIVRASVESGTP